MVMIHKIAELTGLPLLAVEAGFLLLLTIIFVIVIHRNSFGIGNFQNQK